MKKNNIFGELLIGLLNSSEPLDVQMLCESFIIALNTNRRNNNSKKASFLISDGNKIFTINLDMSDDHQIIQSITANEYKEH